MISNKMQSLVANSSIIRAMFDEGKRLAKIHGAENVYDFSLGNPNVEPPQVIKDSIKEILDNEVPTYVHGYMNNSGFEDVRTAIAAHECGHAVQHATAYAPLTLRSKLVPVVSFASNWVQWVLLGGILLINSFPQLLLFGIILFAFTTIFSFVTLPVEINASSRALAWLSNAGITNNATHDKAEDALRSAAYTYVVAALGSLATLLYYVMIFLGSRSRD